jgi:hypothetical protein
MALKKNFEHNGMKVVDGYLKVINVNGDKNRLAAVLSYAVDQSHDSIKTQQFSFVPSMDDGNFIQQAYKYIKSLNGFEDATDC